MDISMKPGPVCDAIFWKWSEEPSNSSFKAESLCMHYAVYNQPNSGPLATQNCLPWFKQNRPLRCSVQNHCENCRGSNGGHTPGIDGEGCHPPSPRSLIPAMISTLTVGGASCWSSSWSQFGTQSGPADEGSATMCPGTVIGKKEGGVKSEQLLIWLEAAPFAWIQPP